MCEILDIECVYESIILIKWEWNFIKKEFFVSKMELCMLVVINNFLLFRRIINWIIKFKFLLLLRVENVYWIFG